MSKGQYNYYDPEYNSELTGGYELLLKINHNYFSFVVLQTATKRVLVWGEDYPRSELQTPAELKNILSARYDDVKVVVQSDSFMVIPKALYNENDQQQYQKYVTAEPGDSILTNELDNDNYVVFTVPQNVVNDVKLYADLKSVFFPGKVFICALKSAAADEANLYVHIEDNKLQVVYFKNATLRFFNTYEYSNPDELMYFVLLAANELGLNLDETSLILSGEVSISDKKIHRLSDLLAKVYLNQAQLVALPQGFLPHQILLLSGLTVCESLVEN